MVVVMDREREGVGCLPGKSSTLFAGRNQFLGH